MASVVQSVTGASGTLVLNNVVAGNALFLIQTFYRATTTGAALATPTDSNGTFSTSITPTPSLFLSTHDIGLGMFHELNAAAGTHTVTPSNTTSWHASLLEVSGVAASSALDVTASAAGTSSSSQATGTTSATAQAVEIVLIAFAAASSTGVNPLGLTNPVSGFTTIQIVDNDLTDIGTMHCYKFILSTGTQSATFNYTDASTNRNFQGAIATYKCSAGALFSGKFGADFKGRF